MTKLEKEALLAAQDYLRARAGITPHPPTRQQYVRYILLRGMLMAKSRKDSREST